MPGATRIGLLAYSPIIRLLKNDTSTVAVSTPLKGRPAWLRMAGLTTMMYMVARKDDSPARSSVRTEKGSGSGAAEADMAGWAEQWKKGCTRMYSGAPTDGLSFADGRN
jgi:hypothetical protein